MFEKYGKGVRQIHPVKSVCDIWEKVFNHLLEKSGIVFLYFKPIGADIAMVAR